MLMSELSVHPDWDVNHIDVCNAFCTAPLEKFIYIHPPEGMIEDNPSLKGKFLCVKNALYGLAASPRAFNQHLHKRVTSYGWTRSPVDHCMYTRTDEHGTSFILMYVDDVLHIGPKQHIELFRKSINIETNPTEGFKVRDYGMPTSFLGMDIHRKGRHVKLSQKTYIDQLATRFNINDGKYPATPLPPGTKMTDFDDEPILQNPTEFREVVGSLMYASHCCRCDVTQATHQLSRYLHAPRATHLKLALGVVRYLVRFNELGLNYDGTDPSPSVRWSDADWAGDLTTRKSTSGYVFKRNNAAVSWSSQLQKTVAHSTSDAEYRALSDSSRENLYLRNLERVITGKELVDPTVLHEDNMGAKKWTDNPSNHSKVKHIELCYHSVREQIGKSLKVIYCKTRDMLADPFTKALAAPDFTRLFKKIFGMGSEKSDQSAGDAPKSQTNDDSPEQGGC